VPRRYCECGRVIRVRIRGRWGPPPDEGHDLCRQCWQSQLMQLRMEDYVANIAD
jgi:hypothetical protein